MAPRLRTKYSTKPIPLSRREPTTKVECLQKWKFNRTITTDGRLACEVQNMHLPMVQKHLEGKGLKYSLISRSDYRQTRRKQTGTQFTMMIVILDAESDALPEIVEAYPALKTKVGRRAA